MDLGVALVVVAGIGAWYQLKSQRIKQGLDTGYGFRRRGRHAAAGPVDPLLSAPSPRESELEREVEQLRERIHVLERIATDGRHSRGLAEEIESLRDR